MSGLKLNKKAMALINYAESIGFEFIAFNSKGHPRLRHRNGEMVTLPCTPGQGRGDKNAIAKLRRIADGRGKR